MPEPNGGSEDIAIIGMSGRFPGARNKDQFWQNLRDGVESITPVSEGHMRSGLLQSLGYVPEELLVQWLRSGNYVKAAASLEDIDQFDADFFGYTEDEAALLDPQHRLFLEYAWDAMEDAGYDAELYEGLIGVYAGAEMSSYHHNLHTVLLPTERNFATLLGNEGDYLATRVAYKLNCRGPAFTVQSACSTSLVAVHVACQSLRNGECDMALVGGVVAYATQKVGYYYHEGGLLSPDGHCRPFDQDAQGTILAQGGVGVVLLKPLAAAVEDSDHIYAVIKGSAINNDGAVKTGYTAPSVRGQARVFAEALAVTDIDPATLGYIEAHGTATPLGDSVEVAALSQVIRQWTPERRFCALGSIKSNMGHLGAASGIAALMKTALALQHKQIPPCLHFHQPHPQTDLANSPFYVNSELISWGSEEHPRRAGVNSIGIGGTNAHVLLEEACSPRVPREAGTRPWQLLMFSARTETALNSAIAAFIDHCTRHPEQPLADMAYTLHVGRHVFARRTFVICQDKRDAIRSLQRRDPCRVFSAEQEIIAQPVLFVCTTFNQQCIDIWREYALNEAVFRQWIDTCLHLLYQRWHIDLYHLPDQTRNRADECSLDLLVSFIVSYALTQVWISWGITPAAVAGIGAGEYLAVCLAGGISLEDTLALIVHREQPNEYERVLHAITWQPLTIPYLSGVNGTWSYAEEIGHPLYWMKHKRQRTMPSTTIVRHLEQKEDMQCLAIGNDLGDIADYMRRLGRSHMIQSDISVRGTNEQLSHYSCLLTALGQLWLAGARVDWPGFYQHQDRSRLPLPTYCFDRRRYWVYPVRPDVCAHEKHDRQDRVALSASEEHIVETARRARPPLKQAYVAARTEVERVLTTICQELFMMERIGVYDSFYDLGGHSLLAVRLVARIRSAFPLDISLASVFEAGNMAILAELIEAQLIEKVETLSEEEVQHLMQRISQSC